MRLLSSLFSAALLVLAASASAGSLPYPQLDPAPASTVQVRAPANLPFVTEEEAHQITGMYAMSNGWRLNVRGASRYVDVRIDKERPMRLRLVAPDTFISRDGSVSMRFKQGEMGDDMTMSYIPDRQLAQVIVLSSRMAQR